MYPNFSCNYRKAIQPVAVGTLRTKCMTG